MLIRGARTASSLVLLLATSSHIVLLSRISRHLLIACLLLMHTEILIVHLLLILRRWNEILGSLFTIEGLWFIAEIRIFVLWCKVSINIYTDIYITGICQIRGCRIDILSIRNTSIIHGSIPLMIFG